MPAIMPATPCFMRDPNIHYSRKSAITLSPMERNRRPFIAIHYHPAQGGYAATKDQNCTCWREIQH